MIKAQLQSAASAKVYGEVGYCFHDKTLKPNLKFILDSDFSLNRNTFYKFNRIYRYAWSLFLIFKNKILYKFQKNKKVVINFLLK